MEQLGNILFFLVLLAFMLFIAMSIRVAKEHERLAVFMLGRYFQLKGPGLVVCIPGVQKAVRLAVGDEGRFKSDEIAEFQGYGLPVVLSGEAGVNTPVRIRSFSGRQVHVESVAD